VPSGSQCCPSRAGAPVTRRPDRKDNALLHQLFIRATAILEAAGAGIMLADDDGEFRYVAATDDRVVAAEQHQDRVRDGVCFEAYTTGQPLAVADLLEDADRWPAYAEGVLHLAFRAVLGIPMRGAGSKICVLNVYRGEPGAWSPTDVDAAEVLGIMGTGYILHGYQQRDHLSVVGQLQAAIDSRDLIGQAKGILIRFRAPRRCGAGVPGPARTFAAQQPETA
jgi:hypothetical protein